LEPSKNVRFPTETACSLQFKLKETKNTVTLIAFNMQIKNILKHDRNKVWYAQFIQCSSNAVIFAVN